MNRLIVPTLLAGALAGPSARADGPTAAVASRAWAVAEAVLARHVDPPARQQMFLAGIKAMADAAGVAAPAGLAFRASDLSTADQLAALMAETLAGPKVSRSPSPEAGPRSPRRPSPSDGPSPEEAFFEGLGSVVPGGATLMSEKERKVQESFEANLYVGIQVKLGVDEKSERPVFAEILQGGPADAAGARGGDLIDEVDGESTAGMPLRRVVDRLRGAEGTDVLVRFRRPGTGEVFTRPMTRGRLPRATVEGLAPSPGKPQAIRFDGPAPIGYLKVTEVSGSTPQELRAFAARLESEGVKALVLDLREVGSARFHETVLLADALLDGGIIGRVASAGGVKTYLAEPDALFRGWPMAVLVEGCHQPGVAWLAEALRDNRRATVLGEPAPLRDPTILEMVALPGGEWSVQIATGRLERGDGRPLDRRSPKGPRGEATALVEPRLQDASRIASDSKQAEARDLARAREILEEALKSAAN